MLCINTVTEVSGFISNVLSATKAIFFLITLNFFIHFFASPPIISAFIPAQFPGHSPPVKRGRIQGEQRLIIIIIYFLYF